MTHMNINYNNNIVAFNNIKASPLLTNMYCTTVPLDRDEDDNIIIATMDNVTVEDIFYYSKFCNTGTILPSDRFNVDLYNYMGHRVREDDIEYTKIRLMEIWYATNVSVDGLNGLYEVDNYINIKPLELIYIMLKGLDYSICYNNHHYRPVYCITNTDDKETFIERYEDYEKHGVLYPRVTYRDCAIDLVTIEFNDYDTYKIYFTHGLSEFSHKVYDLPEIDVLIHKCKTYKSLIVDYMYEFGNDYSMNVYDDCVTETIVDGDTIIEWDEPISKVLSSQVPVNELACDIKVKDNVLYVTNNSDKLSKYEKSVILTYYADCCDKIIIHEN